MKVCIFAGGLDATLTARISPLARALEAYGVECKVILPVSWHSIAKGKLGNLLSIALTHPADKYLETLKIKPDVIIIGRTSTPQLFVFQKLLKRRCLKTIFDLDDALFLSEGKLFGINVRPGSFCLEKMLSEADYVTTNGHYLLNYVKGFNSNAHLIHDPVDVDLFNPKNRVKSSDKITITWEGNAIVNYENLKMLVKPLKMLAGEYGTKVKFKILSYLGDQRVKVLFDSLKRFMEVDYGFERWLPMEQFAKAMRDSDILVAPLMKTEWYEGKSALRVGIGMAMGVPVVASPVGEQKYVIKHSFSGFLAENDRDWYRYLKTLIEDDKMRKIIGRHGRETAEKELSLHVCGKKLFDIITELL